MKVLAIDQGTTGTKSFTFDDFGSLESVASFEHRQIYPRAGWVEHDPEEIIGHVESCIAAAGPVDAIGIDNQGETIIAWDAVTKTPCYNAIVWQDARTQSVVDTLKRAGAEEITRTRAGLPLDPYFSASKLRWIIDHVDEAKALLLQDRLRLGTSDAFILDRLTGEFATDVTTASRTSLMSLETLEWDADLLRLFDVPANCLPEIRDTTGPFGMCGDAPVTASLVDQQAALFGHGCMAAGDMKFTFGTGGFALAIAGHERPVDKLSRLAATVAWRRGGESAVFALEGGIYNAASAVNWAKSIGLFQSFEEINRFDRPSALSRGLVFIPALSGLASPHWDRTASGLWLGLGLDTTRSDMMQAILEGVALRGVEVISAMAQLLPLGDTISIDGGLANNPYFSQFLCEGLNKTVIVQASTEVTALGTARMTMMGAGAVDLPPPLPPAKSYIPTTGIPAGLLEKFREARIRASNWR